MDLTIKLADGYFNYRVAAVIIHDDRLLVMHNKDCNSYYLPGGRVKFNESSQDALKRELKEELLIDISTLRPLWLNEQFFIEEELNEKFHELCLYYFVDINNTDFKDFDKVFIKKENNRVNYFEWIPFDKLGEQIVYPLFIKDRIHSLPDNLEIIVGYEY